MRAPTHFHPFLAVLAGTLAAAGCRGGAPAAEPEPALPPSVVAAAEPEPTNARPQAEEAEPAAPKPPLVVVLHSYNGRSERAAEYHGVHDAAAEHGWVVIAPEGDRDSHGAPYWNASPACCDRDGRGVDHVARLRSEIEAAIATHDVDPARVIVVGASNGAFMAHRMACEASDLVTGIVAVAGVGAADLADCEAEHPVSLLQVHGELDDVVHIEGAADSVLDGQPGAAYPGAEDTARAWAERNGCAPPGSHNLPIGTATRWDTCEGETTVTYLSIDSMGHNIAPVPSVVSLTLGFIQTTRRVE